MSQSAATHNLPEYSVSEISGAIKRHVEDRFGYVRVRGELSGFKVASSGHAYYKLKDDKAVLDAVSWRGSLSQLNFKPEDGLEVTAYGRITTYPGRSNYQIVVERMEPAGAGALMALLEERKKKLAAEGLFAPERKKKLPFLPQTIGVITSPTGAVIRDILHRVAERFPLRVLVWPVAVQGENAAEQIAAAIKGFDALVGANRPDLLIVARGGGSIEDLWSFNEEIVARAAADCRLPLISAVGHETDTTLIDYVADRRAPTPTAAAEMAVPVKADLALAIQQRGLELNRRMAELLSSRQLRLESLVRGLPKPAHLLDLSMQRLDSASEKLFKCLPTLMDKKTQHLLRLSAKLSPQMLSKELRHGAAQLESLGNRLGQSLPKLLQAKQQHLSQLSARLSPRPLVKDIGQQEQQLSRLSEQLGKALIMRLQKAEDQLSHLSRLLGSMSHEEILKRGFALVTDDQGKLISRAEHAKNHMQLEFADGKIQVEKRG